MIYKNSTCDIFATAAAAADTNDDDDGMYRYFRMDLCSRVAPVWQMCTQYIFTLHEIFVLFSSRFYDTRHSIKDLLFSFISLITRKKLLIF